MTGTPPLDTNLHILHRLSLSLGKGLDPVCGVHKKIPFSARKPVPGLAKVLPRQE
jgi:hypothetical protein